VMDPTPRIPPSDDVMDATHPSLLVRARGGDDIAWEDLFRVYRPLIVGWLRHQAIPASDLDDLVQEILMTVVRGLPSFQHSGRPGSFRSWLRTIAHSRSYDYWKSPARRACAPGDAAAAEALADLEDPDSPLNRFWAEEHDRYVLRCLLEMMELEFEPGTMRAFRRVVLDGVSGAEAAAELATTVAAVYAARSRVLRRLREVANGLIDELS
jgi:RNA polymerase sigma-70 factor, ECF subfamily